MDPFYSQMDYVPHQASSTMPATTFEAGSKKNARWKPTEQMAFIATCEIAITEGHRHGRCFTKHGWERVIALFKSTNGHNWTKQQLRNNWDAMRRDHKHLSELVNSTGVEYDPSTGRIVASDEWWTRKIRENKEYKDFKDKDVSEIYIRYHQLFGDNYDGAKYAMTPSKLCRMGFDLFEDSAVDDYVDGEGNASSNDGDAGRGTPSMNISNARRAEKRKSSTKGQKGRQAKISARDLSYFVDWATSASEEVVVKINAIVSPMDNVGVDYIDELLAAGRLQRRVPLYFFACTLLLQKRYRDMFKFHKDTDEKFEWIEWMYNKRINSRR